MRLLLLFLSVIIMTACSNQDISEEEQGNAEVDKVDEEATSEDVSETDSEEDSSEEETEDTENTSTENEDNQSQKDDAENERTGENEAVDLIADSDIIEGYWINYSGVDDARDHMSRTDFIDYNPDQDYTLTNAGYVSYFYGDSFIKTNNYGHDGPYLIEKVPEANRIIVSIGKPEEGAVELLSGSQDDATAGGEENTTPDDLIGQGRPDTENIQGSILFGQDFLSGDDVTVGQKIDDTGEFVDADNYRVTVALAYRPNRQYLVTSPVTVSFYNNRRFIETVEITEAPAYLPQVDGANYINLSFDEAHMFDLNMIEVE